MVKARILRQQNRCFLELPKEMQTFDEVELFQLRDGYYLVTLPLPSVTQAGTEAKREQDGGAQNKIVLSDAERSVLKKLLSIRFESRTPDHVATALSKEEGATLKELEAKGFVNVFRGTKYKDGVYNISDGIYPILSGSSQGENTSGKPSGIMVRERTMVQQPNTNSAGGSLQRISGSIAILNNQGYLVVNDRNEERSLSEALAPRMKSGSVLGVMGFDGKLYIVTRDFFSKAESLIKPALKEDMTVDSIAGACRIDPDGARAVLRIMAENGDVIERRKGVFAPIG